MALPLPPTIHLFSAYPTFASINGSFFGNDGPHIDTEYAIDRVSPPQRIVLQTTGFKSINVTVLGVSLVAGETYRARLRHANAEGFGAFSRSYFASVPTSLRLPAASVPTEPLQPGAPIPLTIQPSYSIRPVHERAKIEWQSETGDLIRRLGQDAQRQAVVLVWENLPTATKDTLRTFLLARMAAVEPFETTGEELGTRKWFARKGRLETRQTAPEVWTVQIEADEIVTRRFWRVNQSQIGGPDEIM